MSQPQQRKALGSSLLSALLVTPPGAPVLAAPSFAPNSSASCPNEGGMRSPSPGAGTLPGREQCFFSMWVQSAQQAWQHAGCCSVPADLVAAQALEVGTGVGPISGGPRWESNSRVLCWVCSLPVFSQNAMQHQVRCLMGVYVYEINAVAFTDQSFKLIIKK